MAQPGDININTFTVGGIDLTSGSAATFNTIDIYEDITRPVFVGQTNIFDHSDALGQNKLDGSQEVKFSFDVPGGDTCNFDFALHSNKNLDDQTSKLQGSMKYKAYDLRLVSQDALNNQSKHLAKSFNQPTHQTVQDALKTISNAQILVPDPCQGNMRLIANHEPVYKFLASIHDKHVSQQNQSSLYTLFASRNGGQENRTFCTFEHLMKQESVFTFKQDNTIGGRTTTESDAMNNILWLHVPDSFNTPVAYHAPSTKNVYDLGSSKSISNNSPANGSFTTLGNSLTSSYADKYNGSQTPPLRQYQNNQLNDKTRTNIDTAMVKRRDYLKDLAQNAVRFMINGNPNIAVGQIVTLKIPKKADGGSGEGETQMNDKILITKIRHKIAPLSVKPRYVMIVEGIKAGSFQ